MISHLFGRITAEQPNTASKFKLAHDRKNPTCFLSLLPDLYSLYYTSFYHNIRAFHLIRGGEMLADRPSASNHNKQQCDENYE